MLIRFTVGCGVDGWVWRINPSRATTHDGRASAEKYKVMGRQKRCVWDCLHWYVVGKSAVVSTCRKHTLPISPASAKQKAAPWKELFTVNAGNVSTETWTSKAAESLLCIGSHMTRVSRGQTVGIQSRTACEYFSSERGHFSPIMELSKEKGREVGEVIIRLTELILRVHMVSLRDSQDVNFSDLTFSRLLKLIHKTSVSCF